VINDSITTPVNGNAVETAQSKDANYHLPTVEQITSFFDGLDLIEPGLVSTPLWRPAPGESPGEIAVYCGAARKP
jgi:S-adenosyl methyltransferase